MDRRARGTSSRPFRLMASTNASREMTTSRRDNQPAGGVRQGVNPRTGSVASAIWVNRPMRPHAIMFITIDGASLRGTSLASPDRDPYSEDGGEA